MSTRALLLALPVLTAWLLVPALAEAGPWPRSPQATSDTPESHQAAGLEALRSGRINEALGEFQAALRRNRDYLPSLISMADLLSSNDRFFEAYGALQHAVSVAPDSAEVRALLGRCLFRIGKLKDARENLQRALESNPDLTEPRLALAAIATQQGRYKDARHQIEEFLRRVPDSTAAKELFASICSDMKDYEAALAAYAELRESDPSRIEIQKETARTLLAAGRYAEAEQAFRDIAEQRPQDDQALRGWFDSSYRRGAYGQAVEAAQKLSKIEPRSCQPILDQARADRMLNNLSLASEQVERCLGLDAANASAHFLLGWIRFQRGDLGRARTELEQSFQLVPNSAETLYWLGMVELQLGSLRAALSRLEKAEALDPDHADVQYQLALAYGKLHRPIDTRKHLEIFRRLKRRESWNKASTGAAGALMSSAPPGGAPDAEHLEDWLSFANYLLQENKPFDALSFLKQAREIAPGNPEVLLLAGAAYSDAGDIDAALEAYALAEKHASTALLYLGRGTIYQKLGENDLAMADLRRALTLRLPPSKAVQAHTQLGSLLSAKRKYLDAETELWRATALDPQYAPAQVLLGWTLLQLARPAEAAEKSLAVLQATPDDVPARLVLARALIEQKRFDEGSAEVEKLAGTEGESARVLVLRGILSAAQGRSSSAIDFFNRAGQADSSQPEAFYLLGVQLFENHRLSEAAIAFEKATILDAAHAQSWLGLGKVYLAANHPRESVSYLKKALLGAPNSGEAHYHLAVALTQIGQLAEATQEAEQAKSLGEPAAESLLRSLASRAPH